MRRAGLLLAAVAAGASALGAGAPDARAACAATLTWRGVDHLGWATRAPLPVGSALGTGSIPPCRDSIVIGGPDRAPERSRTVQVRAIAGVPTRVAVAVAGASRTAYLAPGYPPQLPAHPLHRALFGSDERPLETAGRRCSVGPALRGRVSEAGSAGLRVRLAGGGTASVLVDARTRVLGLERDGLPYLARGARVRIEGLRCAPGREVVARRLSREASAGEHATAAGVREYPVPAGSAPHDVAVAGDGRVWFTAQAQGYLGRLDPRSGRVERVPLGAGSAPHGVIVGPGGAAWVTDGGLDAIVRVDGRTLAVRRFPVPRGPWNLNTAAFAESGDLWFTGQGGIYGRVDLPSGRVRIWEAPRGYGPYGIAVTRTGVWYASLAGSYLGRVDPGTGRARVLQPPTAGQGARRVWPDSRGRLWVSEYEAGRVAVHDPATGRWREWPMPGGAPGAYAIYVDDRDVVWLSDFDRATLVRFDPRTERFREIRVPSGTGVRQLHGRPGEVWGAAQAADRLVVVREGSERGSRTSPS